MSTSSGEGADNSARLPNGDVTLSPSTASESLASPSCEGGVRFDSECIVIPDVPPARKPLMVTRSYTLPLSWGGLKRKPADADMSEYSPEVSPHVVLKVPLPSFMSPKAASRPPVSPYMSCLTHRSTSVGERRLLRPGRERRASLPLPCELPVQHNCAAGPSNVPTIVPLRACCAACYEVTEASIRDGDTWKEKFSRGARRRWRCDSGSPRSSQESAAAVASLTSPHPKFELTVDEVDRRRKSLDLDSLEVVCEEAADPLEAEPEDEAQTVTVSSPSPVYAAPQKLLEDDDLFPLPSPKRSPNASPGDSPAPSVKPSPRASPLPSTRRSPLPSPSLKASSSDRLYPPEFVPCQLTDGPGILPDDSEGIIGHSLSRKDPPSAAWTSPTESPVEINFPATEAVEAEVAAIVRQEVSSVVQRPSALDSNTPDRRDKVQNLSSRTAKMPGTPSKGKASDSPTKLFALPRMLRRRSLPTGYPSPPTSPLNSSMLTTLVEDTPAEHPRVAGEHRHLHLPSVSSLMADLTIVQQSGVV
ncbi:hypothetical protein FISHEDRAFT_70424 [Fistulina hepatica ATCC 64428]|uniref:Uncharacterized protein n=1 Tax=Fistulina hepatica ATCC 64428 TaxID=1128425 RepID=A0A0D7AMC4_9AGAR|nr:hypothetical protein FISHEDRAFT_70424 [Fistulina hepatica ATCC 64428]